jgi:hypothetical protein
MSMNRRNPPQRKERPLVSKQFEIRKQNDAIDEIVAKNCTLHIEQMSDDGWFIGINAADGSYHQFWLGAKNGKSHVEVRHTESVPAPTKRAGRHRSK